MLQKYKIDVREHDFNFFNYFHELYGLKRERPILPTLLC